MGVDLTQIKKCPRCEKEKTWADFGVRRRKGKEMPKPYCKPCQKAYQTAWYEENRVSHIENVGAAKRFKREQEKEEEAAAHTQVPAPVSHGPVTITHIPTPMPQVIHSHPWDEDDGSDDDEQRA